MSTQAATEQDHEMSTQNSESFNESSTTDQAKEKAQAAQEAAVASPVMARKVHGSQVIAKPCREFLSLRVSAQTGNGLAVPDKT